jgi:hypothetical protein
MVIKTPVGKSGVIEQIWIIRRRCQPVKDKVESRLTFASLNAIKYILVKLIAHF